MPIHSRRAFTAIDLLAVVAALPCAAALVSVAADQPRVSSRAIRDAANVRGIQQALVIFAQNNQDMYPIPSRLDAANTTLPKDVVKDIPRNIASSLIYMGMISTEMCVSPAEQNLNFSAMSTYQFDSPKLAANPQNALWDPAFRAYPADEAGPEADGVPAGFSYALTPFVGRRKVLWSNTFSATEAVLGARCPAYDAAPASPGGALKGESLTWTLAPASATGRRGLGSIRLLFPTTGRGWRGNIAFNDGHVNYLTRPDPDDITFNFSGLPAGRRTFSDNLFVNENDTTRLPDPEDLTGDANGGNRNAYLATWINGTPDGAMNSSSLKDLANGLWWD